MSTLSTYNNLFRVLAAEPDSAGRWSDLNIATLVNAGCRAIALELNFPESQQTFASTAGIQEYTMAENLKILRVYVAGQLIVPTDIPSLEGDQLQYFDQTGVGQQPHHARRDAHLRGVVHGCLARSTGRCQVGPVFQQQLDYHQRSCGQQG